MYFSCAYAHGQNGWNSAALVRMRKTALSLSLLAMGFFVCRTFPLFTCRQYHINSVVASL